MRKVSCCYLVPGEVTFTPMEPMAPEEFEGICARLSLSRREFGRRFGTGPNQAQRYADGSVKIPGPTAILLRILDRLPELMSMVPEGTPRQRAERKPSVKWT